MDDTQDLPPHARAALAEEEGILARVRPALEEAVARAARAAKESDLRSVEALRALREEAQSSSDDDLPNVLHEMAVRQRLIERPLENNLPEVKSPYLAHMRVREGTTRKDYLLGRGTFLDPASGVRIVDWRVAPVAQIFYRYREGDDYEEEFPGRVAQGTLEVRRIIVIERGVLTRIVGDGLLLARGADGRWTTGERQALSLQPGGAGTAVRSGSLGVGAGLVDRVRAPEVTATLDAEQYAAISAPPQQPLLVLGTAGSGKTTVALHRLAWVAATDPERHPLSKMRVVVPEEGLARLSRRLLAPLGASTAQVSTLDAWSLDLARRTFGRPIKLCTDPPTSVMNLKRHPATYRALSARFSGKGAARGKLDGLRRRLADLYSDRAFLMQVMADSKGDFGPRAVEDTIRHTLLQLADSPLREAASIVEAERKEAIDGRPFWEGTPEELAGTIDVDDLPILLFLRAQGDGLAVEPAAHLVVDEAEDLSLFELYALGRLLGESSGVTLAGDEAQQTTSSFAGWEAAIATLGVQGATTCRLATSYRCPRPVTELARALLGSLAPESPSAASREGAPVGLFRFADESQAHLFVAGAVRDLMDREPQASVGVVARSPDEAERFYALIAGQPDARLVLQGEFTFEPGIDVTDVDNAKGLEFDYVVVPDASAEAYPATAEARRRLHVAATRTSHQLWIVSGGTPSPLLPPL